MPKPQVKKELIKKAPAKKTAAKLAKKAPVKAPSPKSKAKAPVAKSLKKAVRPMPKPQVKKELIKKAPAKKPAAKLAKKAPVKAPSLKSKAKAPVAKTAKPVVIKAPFKKLNAKQLKEIQGKFASSPSDRILAQQFVRKPAFNKNLKLTPFLTKQRQRLLELKDTLLDAMMGVARDNLHAGSETSAFGMHQADAGSDAYDRDFALSMLSKEQSSLYEIDAALKRIDSGIYGVCEICEKPIRHDRLEALPFTRFTVECQAELEKRQHHNSARPQITSLFGLTEEESESEEEETTEAS